MVWYGMYLCMYVRSFVRSFVRTYVCMYIYNMVSIHVSFSLAFLGGIATFSVTFRLYLGEVVDGIHFSKHLLVEIHHLTVGPKAF